MLFLFIFFSPKEKLNSNLLVNIEVLVKKTLQQMVTASISCAFTYFDSVRRSFSML